MYRAVILQIRQMRDQCDCMALLILARLQNRAINKCHICSKAVMKTHAKD